MRGMLVAGLAVLLWAGLAEAQIVVPPVTCVEDAANPDQETCSTTVDLGSATGTFAITGEATDPLGNKAIWQEVDFPICGPLERTRVGDKLTLRAKCRKGMTYSFTVVPR